MGKGRKKYYYIWVMGIAALFGGAFWLADGIYQYYFFHKNLKFLLLEGPETLLDSIVFNVPPRAIVVRISFIIACLIGGLLVTVFLHRQHEAQKDLAESEEKYRALHYSSRDAIMMLTPEKGFFGGNPATIKMFGCQKEDEFISLTLPSLSPEYQPDGSLSVETAQKMMAIAIEKGSHSFEWKHKRVDGEEFYANVILTRMELHGDKFLQATVRDITEHKRAELDLEASETRYRRLFESARDGILILDADTGMIVDVNPFMLDLLDYSYEAFVGKHLWDIGVFKDIAASQTSFRELQTKNYIHYEHLPLQTRDGRRIDVEFVSHVYLVDNQKVIQCNIRNITDRKRAEQTLREKEQRLSMVVDGANVAVWDWDLASDVTHWNEKLTEVFGLPAGRVKDSKNWWKSRIHPEDAERVGKSRSEYIERGRGTWRIEYRFIRGDGSTAHVYVWSVASRLPDGTPVRMAGAMMDITERKNAEEELRKHHEHLEKLVRKRTSELEKRVSEVKQLNRAMVNLLDDLQVSNKNLEITMRQLVAANKELEAFAYSVSHDLRAPLRSINGFSEALLEDYADKVDEQGKDHLRRVREGAQRMGELIEDLLKLSRITRWEIEHAKVDISALARKTVASLRQSQPERDVEVVIEDGLMVDGDIRLLRVVMENLLDNAWKFSGRTANARIEVGRLPIADRRSPIGEGEAGDARGGAGQSKIQNLKSEIVFFVRDNGVGFDMAYVDNLFGAFQRLHSTAEFAGTGIGLATVQRAVLRHGGRVWAEGEVGKGATFYFTLK